MKTALIFSDSHGSIENTLSIIKEYPQADAIFHCGDIENDADRLRQATHLPVAIVRGNCDYDASLPEELVTTFAGKKIAMCHGHCYFTYGEMDVLKYWGMEKQADILLFGHTHEPFLEQSSELTILNPGSISRPRQLGHRKSYAVMEIDERGEINISIEYIWG